MAKKKAQKVVSLEGVIIINLSSFGTEPERVISALLRYHPVAILIDDPTSLATIMYNKTIPATNVRRCSRIVVWSEKCGSKLCDFIKEWCTLNTIPVDEVRSGSFSDVQTLLDKLLA